MTTEPKPICPRCSESSAVQAHKQLDGSTAYWCDRLGCAGWINTLTPRKGHFTADFEGAPVARGGTAPPVAKPKRSRKLRAPPTASEPTPEPQPGPLICRPPTEAEAEQMAAEHPQYARPVAEQPRSNIESVMGPEGSPESRAAAVQAFEDLAAKVERLKNGQPAPDPLSVPCPKCRAGAGEKCKNYKGQNKQTCPTRGKPSRLSKEGERLAAKPLFGKEWEQQAADSSEGTGATPEGSAEGDESSAPAPDADDEEGWYTCTCKCGCRIPVPPDGPSYCPECLGSPKKHKPPEGQPDDGIARCRVCGCSEDDCYVCVMRTGEPCRWADAAQDLCTACARILNAELDLVPGIPAGTLKALQKAHLQHVGQVVDAVDPGSFTVARAVLDVGLTGEQRHQMLTVVGDWVKAQLGRTEEGAPLSSSERDVRTVDRECLLAEFAGVTNRMVELMAGQGLRTVGDVVARAEALGETVPATLALVKCLNAKAREVIAAACATAGAPAGSGV